MEGSGAEANSGAGANSIKRHLGYSNLALTTFERLGNLMMDFLIPHMLYKQNFKTLRPPQGLEQAHVVQRPGPDHLRQMQCLSGVKLDRDYHA